MKGPLFYSKILLFGEYGIIRDSRGLSIPYNFYKGALKKSELLSDDVKKSNESLKKFSVYLQQMQDQYPDLVTFDIDKINEDIAEGMYFDSSIPQGYGVGSSGALVAAIYDQYALSKITVLENLTREKLLELKKIFSQMESFFHGTSSGLDPLNSYLSLPILINSKDNIEPTGIPSQQSEGKGAVFLIDSEMIGETAPMVTMFMENLKNEGFRNMMKSEFNQYTNACIDSFLSGNFKKLFSDTKQLSKLVFNHFKPMIPERFHQVWQKGIETNDYYLKLCGSGGGGYILGFAPDFEKAQKALKDYKLEVVYRI
ncbi:mevalonate kinase family protein [Avrilella dinanensis]|uniref:Mevalonate kinase n=1 Tax=Avrilella dinanensis TaxID=2008672 RepID=A0A2M9R7B7_9FLAO|nr:mevalonate kinase [Avrilella dinanensis]PJR04752.1 mevalonate kinase [Avrilella dinanensis]